MLLLLRLRALEIQVWVDGGSGRLWVLSLLLKNLRCRRFYLFDNNFIRKRNSSEMSAMFCQHRFGIY